MKKEELKKLLKPLIKECIKEVIFEKGVLSGIVSEVAQGLGTPLVEARAPKMAAPVASLEDRQEAMERRRAQLNEQKNKLLGAISKDAYGGVDIFEGTNALSSGGKVSSGPQSPQGPLADTDPNDPGVDISGILGIAANRWSAHMKS